MDSIKEEFNLKLKALFENMRPELVSENNKRKRVSAMNDDLKMLLKILLEQEIAGEAGQNVRHPKKKLAPEPEKGIDFDPAEKTSRAKRSKDTMKDTRIEDLLRARSDLYTPHDNNITNMKEVPIWEKYALTVTEAAEYFHLGTKSSGRSLLKISMPNI